MSPKLHLVRVPLMTQSECYTAFLEAGYKLDIDKTKVCAGWPQGGKDACQVSALSINFRDSLRNNANQPFD